MHDIRDVLCALEEQGFFPPADPKWAALKSHSSSAAQKLGSGAVHLLRLAGGWSSLKLRRTVSMQVDWRSTVCFFPLMSPLQVIV